MSKKKQALRGFQQRRSPHVHSENDLLMDNITTVQLPQKLERKPVLGGKKGSFEDLIVYPTGKRRSAQQTQAKVIQKIEQPIPHQSNTIQRQIVSCVVYLKLGKLKELTLRKKLSLIKAILRLLKREISEAREKDVLAPSFVTISSEERKHVISIKLPDYIVPKFLRIQPSKERNKFLSRQLGDASMSITLKFRSGKISSSSGNISMEALLRYLPSKVDTMFREMVQTFMSSNDLPALKPFLTVLKNEATVKPPSESTGDPRDYDVLVRLKTGARFRVEKRYTMKGSVLRVAKGTKIEFFWSHLFNWFRDLTLEVKARKSLFSRMPVNLLTIIIQYTVEEPIPELDFRNWFTAPVTICRMTVNDKKWKKRYSQRLSNYSYIKTIPKSFWALKKRFRDEQNQSHAKLSSEDVENLFQMFDGFDYKFVSTS